MQIEDITWVGFTSRRTLQNQRKFTVSHRLLREVVVDNERIASTVAEILADSGTGKWRVVAHGSRVACRSGNDYGVVHSAVLFQCAYQRCNRRGFLTNCHIDAVNRLALFEILALVDNSVDSNSCLSYLTVADDKFALTAADRHHRVDSLQSCLQRLLHRLAENNARRFTVEWQTHQIAFDRSTTVDRFTQDVDYTPQ